MKKFFWLGIAVFLLFVPIVRSQPSYQMGDFNIRDSLPNEKLKHFTAFNDQFIFVPLDDLHGYELWISDGTSSGTHLIRDTYPGADCNKKYNLTYYNGQVFFLSVGEQVWVTDGTTSGTRLFSPDSFLQNHVHVSDIFVSQNKLFFSSESGLWLSDGTEEGTILFIEVMLQIQVIWNC
ncbi:MAG: hypothetical protein CSA81_03195 [Acidobacteria bacterium]|nr:MAG: hypothetical protein CSA81_03195 [Acidobacteriota bacterium]